MHTLLPETKNKYRVGRLCIRSMSLIIEEIGAYIRIACKAFVDIVHFVCIFLSIDILFLF